MAKSQKEEGIEEPILVKKMTCGIIMPIAGNQDYSTEHWKDVLSIISEAIHATEIFEPKLVSEDVAIGLIHERIVSNIYNNEIVVCDVSSKNPNVMFELGMRLAFDKPTIIVKDSDTGYSFDTGPVEHLNYPRTLRFADIVNFKLTLAAKITATYNKSQDEADFSPFLKSFGKTIKPAKITETEITQGDYIVSELGRISKEIRLMRREGYLRQEGVSQLDTTSEINNTNLMNFVKGRFLDIIKRYPGRSTTELVPLLTDELQQSGFNLPEKEVLYLVKKLLSGDEVIR
ncbi:hypothetical protein [Dyadobacter sp. CY343]|uniref:hypothetical protein n=1 Tax=Dyadobacter sp. CY343 TaxID=2907299 RepID=UPI001F344A46|nr:hypothetical protein [Dyadobacter sp. CY343]MCE7061241.1 hypothetical protein [Dyadobacter sp. CY343]